MINDKKISLLKKWIEESNNIVFFGGAGVSTESGIADFRSEDGLYNQKYKYPPETILSHTFFEKRPEEFYEFYRDKLLFPDAVPNKAHISLAELEKRGKLKAVITQNIDGLHQKAGSRNVLELHGSVFRNYCTKCGKKYSFDFIIKSAGVPTCSNCMENTVCGGIIRPEVVLYEEALDMEVLSNAVDYVANSDVFIVAGTSLKVYPVANLVTYYNGCKLVLINKSETSYDKYANLLIRGQVGEVLSQSI